MRGEDALSISNDVYGNGSPPHARGRPVGKLALSLMPGITPACAGKTVEGPAAVWRWEDHPRMRGEDGCLGFGLPGGRWITPACAGKTSSIAHLMFSFQDHPRMRGEDHSLKVAVSTTFGSPPHARGRRDQSGNANCNAVDHPRMRGEDFLGG